MVGAGVARGTGFVAAVTGATGFDAGADAGAVFSGAVVKHGEERKEPILNFIHEN